MAASLFLDLEGNPLHDSEILGYGGTGVVTYRDSQAVKIPLRHPWSTDADVESNMEVIAREQGVYARFGQCPTDQVDGIVPCVGLHKNATHLAYMENGDLRTYLEKHPPPYRAVQMRWFRQMARALQQVHDQCVLVADIATRNFLLDSNLSIRICDFSEASLLPLGTEMETADDDGFSIQTDIGQLGAVMYEVVTRQKCDFDLFKDGIPADGRAVWPPRDSLPRTEGIWLGRIIETCWVEGGFQNAHALSLALSSVEPDGIIDQDSLWTKLRSITSCTRQLHPQSSVFVLAVLLSAAAVVGAWTRKPR